ncbi:hypothetical protein MP228_008188 [Amoeboaphelidium protococcarum]|nr:hypothetical protein MP228_008188 [Amoeboaphelidium protococcarum]
MVLCCQCGVPTPQNPANMCVNCIRNDVDLSDGIAKQQVVNWCRNCDRFLQPPNSWVTCALESKELMALLLRKIKGLNKVKLVDASFIWTEAHSRRLITQLTVQGEPYPQLILQQQFQIEWIVQNQMCEACTRLMAQDSWNATVQLRQKVKHKRTFFYLEQVILKHNAHKDTTNIKERKDGLDFYFALRQHALNFLHFIQGQAPLRIKEGSKLISADIKSNTANTKFTISAELIPICKDDIVVLPLSLARSLGSISPLVMCTRVRGGGFTVMDVRTGQQAEVQNNVYWRDPFPALVESGVKGSGSSALSPFFVVDVERLDQSQQQHSDKYVMADVTVCRCTQVSKEQQLSEMDIDFDNQYIVRSHLGAILKEGDYVQGVSLLHSNFNSDIWDQYYAKAQTGSKQFAQIPDVILIKKLYEGTNKKNGKKKRKWKLKRIANGMEAGGDDVDMDMDQQAGGHSGGKKMTDAEKKALEWEEFMNDIEQDQELRGMINLYKNTNRNAMDTESEAGEGDGGINLAELLDDLDIDDTNGPDL